jgi:hypothetical protein
MAPIVRPVRQRPPAEWAATREKTSMSDRQEPTPVYDEATGLPLDRDALLANRELEQRVRAGDLSTEQAAEVLQAAERRHTAEHGPDLDTNEEGIITTGGFGSGQGMEKQRTGQGPSDR